MNDATNCGYCIGTAESCAGAGIKCCPDCTGVLHQTFSRALRAEALLGKVTAELGRADDLGQAMTVGLGRAAEERDAALAELGALQARQVSHELAYTDLSRRLVGERETVVRWRDRALAAEAEINRWPHDWETRFPCDGGCSDYPEEDCSRHGRTPATLWEAMAEIQAERDRYRDAVERVAALCDELDGKPYWSKVDSVNAIRAALWPYEPGADTAAVYEPHEFVTGFSRNFLLCCKVCGVMELDHPRPERPAVPTPFGEPLSREKPEPCCGHYDPHEADDLCCRCGVVVAVGDPAHCMGAGSPDHEGDR